MPIWYVNILILDGHWKTWLNGPAYLDICHSDPDTLIRTRCNAKLVTHPTKLQKVSIHASYKTVSTWERLTSEGYLKTPFPQIVMICNYKLQVYKLKVVLSLKHNIGDRRFLSIWNKVEQWPNWWQYIKYITVFVKFIAIVLFQNFNQVPMFNNLGQLQFYFKFSLYSISLKTVSENLFILSNSLKHLIVKEFLKNDWTMS